MSFSLILLEVNYKSKPSFEKFKRFNMKIQRRCRKKCISFIFRKNIIDNVYIKMYNNTCNSITNNDLRFFLKEGGTRL